MAGGSQVCNVVPVGAGSCPNLQRNEEGAFVLIEGLYPKSESRILPNLVIDVRDVGKSDKGMNYGCKSSGEGLLREDVDK